MKSSGIILFTVLLFFACTGKRSDESALKIQSGPDGADVSVVEVIPVAELLKDPDNYVDRVVKVEGLVTHVCKHSGQRLHLSDENGEVRLRVEAGNKIGRFERELEGSEIVTEGILHRQVIDEAYIEEMERNGRSPKGMHAEDENETGKGEDDGEPGAQEQAENMRRMLRERGTDRVVMYWLDGESFEEKN